MSPDNHRNRGVSLVMPMTRSTLVLLALFLLPSPPGRAQERPVPTCEACHGELELLRQHVETLDSARALFAPVDTLASSAHASLTCTDCHVGFSYYPHRNALQTRGCAYCHEAQETAWSQGVHGSEAAGASCTSCHGVHDVLSVDSMATGAGIRRMRAACASCHFEPRIPEDDPHADSVACTGCHEPHRTLSPSDRASQVNVLNQVTTCGRCHESVAAKARQDVHYQAVLKLASVGGVVADTAESAPPSCTACHGAHGMLAPSSPQFKQRMVARCSTCHEHYAETFDETYHGQATALGSETVATCEDCHSAHSVFPASDPRSTVAPDHLMETCRQCHPAATQSFAAFEPHADPHNRAKYPFVYWAYHLMTALLIGVFVFFGAHTALWLARLAVDAWRGTAEGGH